MGGSTTNYIVVFGGRNPRLFVLKNGMRGKIEGIYDSFCSFV